MKYLDPCKEVSLYIHIPFCNTKCGYCAFYSETNLSKLDNYYKVLYTKLTAIVEDIKKPFHTIYIGGGNPSLIGFDKLIELINKANKYGKSKEITVELNPENVNRDLEILLPYISRISIGIQSFNNDALKTLQRRANREINIQALNILSKFKEKYDFQYNADLIVCIPNQPIENMINDISTLSSFNPDHISLYSLTFEEGTALIKDTTPLSEREEELILTTAWNELDKYGYKQYEISNFAKDEKYSKHNLVYWALGQYVGIGSGAESSVGYNRVCSLREAETIDEFIKKPQFNAYYLNEIETEEEFLLASLRTIWGIDKIEYQNRFNKNFDFVYSSSIERLNKKHYVNTDKCFRITKEGFMVLNRIIVELAMSI